MANAAKAPAAGVKVRFQNLGYIAAQAQIRMPDDTGGDACLAVFAAGAHGRDAVDEFGLADHAQGHRAVGPDHGAAFDEDSGDDVVAAVQILQDLVEEITVGHALVFELPKMMMRITDRQVGINRFLHHLGQPFSIRRLRRHGNSPPAPNLLP